MMMMMYGMSGMYGICPICPICPECPRNSPAMLGDTSVPSRVTKGAASRASRWYMAQCPHTASPAAFAFVQFWQVHAGRGADVGEVDPSLLSPSSSDISLECSESCVAID